MVSLDGLVKYCDVRPDNFVEKAFILRFDFDEAVTTIRIAFEDRQSGASMVITNMTTLPSEIQRKGFGSRALQTLLDWARSSKLENIRAVQVQRQSESFWTKNGFIRIGNITNDFQYSPTIRPAD